MSERDQTEEVTLDTQVQGILNIFGCEIADAGKKIMAAVMMHDLEVLSACSLLLSADIRVDLLQKIYHAYRF